MLKIVCISDTHNRHRELTRVLHSSPLGDSPLGDSPLGDVLVHSGDFTNFGTLEEVRDFVEWFESLRGFRHKILIAGNHDVTMDPSHPSASSTPKEDLAEIRRLVTESREFHYLHDSSVVIDGTRFYGAPYVCLDMPAGSPPALSPQGARWAFSLSDIEIASTRVWERIPDDTDVLITHGPPFGIMDRSFTGNVGDDFLLLEVMERVRPRVHIFGHVHNQQGELMVGETRFVNAVSQGEYDAPLLVPLRIQVPKRRRYRLPRPEASTLSAHALSMSKTTNTKTDSSSSCPVPGTAVRPSSTTKQAKAKKTKGATIASFVVNTRDARTDQTG